MEEIIKPFNSNGSECRDRSAQREYGYELSERTQNRRQNPSAEHEVCVEEGNGQNARQYVGDG